MPKALALFIAALMLSVMPGAPLRSTSADAATFCGTGKKCITINVAVGRVWREGDDPLNVTRYDVKVDAAGLPAGTMLYWAEHLSDGTFRNGFALAQASNSGRAQGTVSPICPSWFYEPRPIGGKVSALLAGGEIYERWVAPSC